MWLMGLCISAILTSCVQLLGVDLGEDAPLVPPSCLNAMDIISGTSTHHCHRNRRYL